MRPSRARKPGGYHSSCKGQVTLVKLKASLMQRTKNQIMTALQPPADHEFAVLKKRIINNLLADEQHKMP